MENLPYIKIFVLNWNGKAITQECLESVFAILYKNYTVTLVDNGSTDGSAEYFSCLYPDLEVISLPENIGFTGGSNRAISYLLQFKPQYICFVSNDVVVAPDFLNKLVKVAEADPKIGILNPKIYYAEPSTRIWYAGGYFSPWLGKGVHKSFRKNDVAITKDKDEEVSSITGCVYLARTKILQDTGGFDDRFFNYAEDTDLALRIKKLGYKAYYVADSVVWHKESFDIQRNEGKAYQNYYMTRNILLLMSIHATVVQRTLFSIVFLFRNILMPLMYYAVKGEFARMTATLKGVRDYFLGKYGKQKVAFR